MEARLRLARPVAPSPSAAAIVATPAMAGSVLPVLASSPVPVFGGNGAVPVAITAQAIRPPELPVGHTRDGTIRA